MYCVKFYTVIGHLIVYLPLYAKTFFTASNEMIIVNDELERMWKKGVMACF
jgi:hypothetical protein